MNGWFPALSPDGRHVASGSGELWLDDQALGVAAWSIRWASPSSLIFNAGAEAAIFDLDTRHRPTPLGVPANATAGGGRRWASWAQTTEGIVHCSWRSPIVAACAPSLNSQGDFAYLAPYQAYIRNLYVQRIGQPDTLIDTAWIVEARIGECGVAYLTAEPGNKLGLWFADWQGTKARILTCVAGEAHPIPVVVDGEDWVVFSTNPGVAAIPVDGPAGLGYLVDTGGQSFNPDACGVPGGIRVVYSSSGGELRETVFRLSDPRVALESRLVAPPAPPTVPKPDPPKPDVPKPDIPKPKPEPQPQPPTHPAEPDEDHMPLLSEDQFEKWLDEAAAIAAPLLKIDLVQAKQGCREQADRWRKTGRNPTVWELVSGAYFRAHGMSAEELDALAKADTDATVRLRR